MNRSPLVPADLLHVVTHSELKVAENGDVFYVRVALDGAANTTRTGIWRARAGAVAAFTSGPKDSRPRISPDGRTLAFVSDRGDGVRVYAMSTDGGEPRALTAAYPAIAALEWSPGGERIAFVATAAHDPLTAGVHRDETSGAQHIRRLPFKSDADGLLDGRRKHLFTIDAGGGEATQVTSGDYDVEQFALSPDGRFVAIVAVIDRPENTTSPDLHVVDLGSGERRCLTPSEGPAFSPAFSHDGRFIAFLGHRRGDRIGGRVNTELWVIPSAGGEMRSLSAALDRSIGDFVLGDLRSGHDAPSPQWTAEGDELVVMVSSEGATSIRAIRVDGTGQRTILGGDRHIVAFDRDARGTIAFVESTPIEPSRLALFDGSSETALTDDNAWLAQRAVRSPRRLRPTAEDETRLDAWILDPDEPSGAPLVIEIHGGPHAAYGWTFFFEFQMLASHGIGVVFGNPRGGQSYGEGYADAITGRWGELDAADVLTILDAALSAGAWDRSRLGVAGGSYGGFMTTWLLGHTDRFVAGVSMRAVNEFVTQYTASDINVWIGEEIRAGWDDAGAKLFAKSPMRSAHRIESALLVEHSERDYRCPIDQGDALFTLLRSLGRTNVEYVRFTGDGHELSRGGSPRNRILRLRAIAHWFIRHLRPAGIDAALDAAGALFSPLPTETAQV